MIEELINWLVSNQGYNFYLGVLLLLILGGLGFPIPEDLPLLIAGIGVAKNIVDAIPIFLVCYFGVVFSDQVLYFIGYFFGKRLIRKSIDSPLLPGITEERIRHVRDEWRRHKYWLIIAARHLFPIRSVTFISAGTLHVPYWEFLLADAIAGLISVALIIGLGILIGENITPTIANHLINEAHYYIVALCVLIATAYLSKRVFYPKSSKVASTASATETRADITTPDALAVTLEQKSHVNSRQQYR